LRRSSQGKPSYNGVEQKRGSRIWRLCYGTVAQWPVQACEPLMFVCEGVFVMVTMAVSTVSVIESIFVIRLCTFQTTTTRLPFVVRFVAFRLIGRVLCVSCPSDKVSPSCRVSRTTLPYQRCSSPAVKSGATSDAATRNTDLDDVLTELRKVNSLNMRKQK